MGKMTLNGIQPVRMERTSRNEKKHPSERRIRRHLTAPSRMLIPMDMDMATKIHFFSLFNKDSMTLSTSILENNKKRIKKDIPKGTKKRSRRVCFRFIYLSYYRSHLFKKDTGLQISGQTQLNSAGAPAVTAVNRLQVFKSFLKRS